MRKMMAAAAAIGVAAATTRGTAQSGNATDAGDAQAVTGDGSVTPIPTTSESGYMVVDPIPPPARGCACDVPGSDPK
jgi:hypothetical protein